jgi:hypothetical protein
MWDGSTRMPLEGSPQAVADLAFFVQPAIADLDGDGTAETIAGTSTYTLSAFDGSGAAPAGWPKLTGGWMVGTPAVGDWDGDGALDIAAPRRDGVLLVWSAAPGSASDGAVAWSQWGCDAYHSGACVDTAAAPIEPEPPGSTTTTSTTAPAAESTTTTAAVGPTTDPADPPVEAAAASGSTSSTGSLPVTGATIGGLVALGLVLVLVGRLVLAAARRR